MAIQLLQHIIGVSQGLKNEDRCMNKRIFKPKDDDING